MTTALHFAGLAMENFATIKILRTSRTSEVRELDPIDGNSDEAGYAYTGDYRVKLI
jgi:hypothetical protein